VLLGAITGVSFRRFRTRHWEHHRSYGEAEDPQRFHYRGIASMSRGAFAWHLFKPLLGCNVPYVFPESYLSPRNLGKAAPRGELVLLIVVQIALAALITGGGRHPWAALLPLVAAGTFGLFLSQIRGIAEHGVRDATEPRGFVRSHKADWLAGLILYDLHFNLHEEHHRRPQIPSCRLPAALREARDPTVTSRPTMWRTLSGMLR
jgi:fatty acid desaturase